MGSGMIFFLSFWTGTALIRVTLAPTPPWPNMPARRSWTPRAKGAGGPAKGRSSLFLVVSVRTTQVSQSFSAGGSVILPRQLTITRDRDMSVVRPTKEQVIFGW